MTVEKAAYAAQNSPELANAAYSATKGTLVGPLRSALGYTLVRVEAITQTPGKSLEQAKAELVKSLTAQKTLVAMSDAHDKIDDAIGNRATFDEIARDHKLDAKLSPPLLTTGINPDDAASKADPAFTQIVAAGFAAEQGDDPQIVPFGTDGSFAVVSLARIVPAAPRKPAEIHDALIHDFLIERAQRAAQAASRSTVTAQVNKSTPLAQTLARYKALAPSAAAHPRHFSRATRRQSGQGACGAGHAVQHD